MRFSTSASALSVILLACASPSVFVPIDYQTIDRPSEGRIEMLYRNTTGKVLCITDTNWPNQGGKLNNASDVAFLVVGSERFPVKDFNTGYCVGEDCVTQIAPGEEISGSISYEDFSLPEQYWNASKRLDFSAKARVCKAR